MLGTAAAQAIGNLVTPAVQAEDGIIGCLRRKYGYVRNLSENIAILEREERYLLSMEADVTTLLNRKEQIMERTRECTTWLEEVQEMKGKIQELRNRYQNTSRCFCGLCPFPSLLKLGKTTVTKTAEVIDLKSRVERITLMVERAPTSPIPIRKHPEKIGNVPSLDEHVEMLIKLLKDDKLKRIGVWGLPGVGKTTVMEKLNNKVHEIQLFDDIFWVTVTKGGSVRKIQLAILEQLKVEVKGIHGSDQMADIISEILVNKKYLLLLDEVFSEINLKEVGIHDDHEYGAVIFAYRDREFCCLMDDHIKIERLSNDDAKNLFRKIVGNIIDRPAYKKIADRLLKECGGMPQVIKLIAYSLRNEDDPAVWRHLLSDMQSPGTEPVQELQEETKSSVEPSLSGSSKLVELPEPVIMPSSLEKYESFSARGTEVMDEKGKMPILDTETETLPSQPKEEGWTEFKLPKHAGEPIEPLTALAASTSGTSKRAVEEPVSATMLPSGKVEIEMAPIDGQLLVEVSTCLKRSIERTSLNILRCMNDDKARRIGVHGSGGIGKTSVLKALINYPIIKDLFDVVIWVTVSRNWSKRKVQDEVLRQLSLSSKTDYDIAEKLFQVLKGRRFLLLLDDVWERIDLNAVGIPNPTLENSSRIIFATRSPDVCHIMAADREVPVERLLPEEAWELFQEQVGSIINCPNIQPYAHDMVQKCGGLPLLIIVTGRAMAKENDALRWMHASREFSRCSAHGIYGLKSIVQQMKFSYDRLEGPDLKSCLLYCALLPEDREVSIFELVEYWLEEGLISGNCTDTYKRGNDIVDVLVGAYLLQSSECGLSIKMHDLIRDLASVILSLEAEGCQFLLRSYSRMTMQTDMGDSSSYRLLESFQSNKPSILHGHQLLLRAGAGLTVPPLKDEWEESKLMFLMDNELSNLPEKPNCPKLLALFLQRNHQLRVIPSSFFDLMPSLTILNLSKTRIKSLPKSLFKVMRLKALILRNCERLAQLPSGVGSLGQLEVLDLQGTEIEKLPDEISELAFLRHLKVSFYGSVNQSECVRLPHELVPLGIISSLCELETLSIDVFPGDKRWDKNVDFILNEMGNLKKLITFCCYFPEVKFLERFLEKSLSWKIQGLTDFKFVVGPDVKRFIYQVGDNLEFEYVQCGQCLRFVNGEIIPIPDAVLKVLTCSTAFYLDHHIKVCNLSEFGISNLNGLKLCIVRDCPNIETVIASKELVIFPILEHLSIYYLSNLGRLWEGMIPQGSFDKLRILTVHTCPKLQFVFASSMLQFFSNLEELIVEHCPGIKEIIFQDQVVDSGSGTLPRLKTLKLHYLPELVTIMQGTWPPLENISFYYCPMLKKLVIDSNTSHSIKEIKAENHWWEKLKWQDTSIRSRLHAHFIPISDCNL